jgi:hypothetical protein
VPDLGQPPARQLHVPLAERRLELEEKHPLFKVEDVRGHRSRVPPSHLPDRAIIPIIAALAGGFITGVITAVTQTYSPETLVIGVVVGVFVFATGFASVIRAEGEEKERWIVGALRGLVAAATFGFLYVGLLVAVRDGSGIGLGFLVLAGVFGALLTRFRVRDRGQLEEYGGRGQPAA